MAETNDTLWLPVLPSMKGFGPALAKGAGAEADKSGKAVGGRFGKAVMLGTAAVGAGAIAAGTALYKVGEIFDDVADTIRVGTGATGKDLDGLIDVAKRVGGKVPAEFEAIGSTVADVNTRMGLSGETLELVASQYLEAGRILGEEVDIMKTGAAFNAFKIEGDDVSGALDHLFQVSQATGLGMNELADAAAKNAPAMQTLGFSFEETTAMVGSFDKAGLNSSALMASMGKGLVTLAKDGEKPQEAFKRVQGEIMGFIEKGDEAGALNLASKVFGTKGATQFVGALKNGTLNLDDMSKAAGQTSDTIMGAGAETMDFAEHWQIFKNKILVALEPIASRVFGGMGTLMENLGAVLESHVIPAFEGLLGFIDRNKVVLGIFGGVIATVAAGFWLATAAMKAWTFATTGWSAITKIAAGVQKAFNLAMKANPIMFVVTLIVALVAAIVWLYKNNETARKIIDGAWIGIKNAISFAWNNVIKPVFTAITNFVKNTLGAAFTWLRDKVITPVWNGIKSGISGAWAGIKATFNAINTFIRGTLAGAFAWFKNSVITPVWNGIKSAISGSWSGIKGTFNAIRDFLRNTLGPVFTWLRDSVIKPVWNGIKGYIEGVWKNGIKPIFDIIQKVLKGDFVGAFQTAKDAVGRIWKGIANVVRKPINFVIGTVYNQGIKKVFDKVAGVVGIDPMPKADEIPAFAKGGQMKDGWKLVGEEGPELINTGPGFVYTAKQTTRMLNGKQQMPMSAINQPNNPIQAHAGIGGFGDLIGAAGRGLKNAWKASTDWIRGGLAAAAKPVVDFIKGQVSSALGTSGFGGMAGGAANKLLDGALSFLRGKDADMPAEDGGGGSFGGGYSGPLGRFHRPGGRITSGFGSSRGRYPHAGIDFAVPIGTAVKAMFDGVVRKNGWNAVAGRSGKGQIIDHGQGYSSYTGHLSGWTKQPGAKVTAGETTALSGNTGRSTGPHAHRELWKNGKPFNFASYLYDNGGVLNPGLSTIMNKTGKPEAILSNSQWKNMSTLANQAAQSMGGGTDAEAMRYALHGMEIKMQTESGTVFAKLVNKGVSDLTRGKKSILS
ncbi:peptidoglycan DD-metalloendopeptidase family protein [Paeniglutamicibacter gangotriensis]|uniref:peptidoglycan DD-metalloendopeptidase family protein n=1 Tax=Paeniglutamicibacter gangotriensis TaxID=254787 RepID=UPI0037CCB995